MAPENDPRVIAIRADSRVGRDSCQRIDECYSDAELVADLDALSINTPWAALKWAHTDADLFDEGMENARIEGGEH